MTMAQNDKEHLVLMVENKVNTLQGKVAEKIRLAIRYSSETSVKELVSKNWKAYLLIRR